MANTGSLRSVDRGSMLCGALAEIRGTDEQQPLAARERGAQRAGLGEVGVPHDGAALGE